MTEDFNYICRILRKTINITLLILGLFLGIKLSVFFMPFLIAFFIYLIIEPIIKFFMKKMRFNRKISSIIIFILIFSFIIGITVLGIVTFVSEATNLLEMLNLYINKAYTQIQEGISKINIERLSISKDIIDLFKNSSQDILIKISNWITNFLTKFLNIITSIPTVSIYIAITIMSLYFMCTDKIYMLDFLEQHVPPKWVQKIGKYVREIATNLGGYLKAEIILILISFVISIIGLYIFKFVGMNVKYPLLMAIVIGFVDALPILGSGTIMIPWSVISALNGDIKLGISIVVLWITMSIIRQFLEPKIVSGKIGIHPIFTLIAMYTGFKLIGIMGMLVGPIVLIILKSLFSKDIDKDIYNKFFI